MAAPQASSRLELLQARFQRKQLQEKEQKLLQLYDRQQQRAYQVVQRGSAGSNVSHNVTTVTRTSNSSHTTSTSHAGKVRQMFDERRQTTVKGIDRSYPLEPLENKPRKQTNGNGPQRNGTSTMNRHSVSVKQVSRSEMNSNLNDGKPVVSYHEVITRESFGPSGLESHEISEFGNENHVDRYENGNHQNEQTLIEEVLDNDTMEKNRMMAKLHLMDYDESLKHRVKNDLESEEFPEDYMVNVPDKIPKQTVAKKLSQAEARLERFKSANARRSNSLTTKNHSIVPKKRSEPLIPAKTTPRTDRTSPTKKRDVSNGMANGRTVGSKLRTTENYGKTISSERKVKGKDNGPRFFCKESEKSATTYAIDSNDVATLSSESLLNKGRSTSPKQFPEETESSITNYDVETVKRSSMDSQKTVQKRSKSPIVSNRKENVTFGVKSSKKSPETSKNKSVTTIDNPKFFCEESEKSATTFAIDPKTVEKFTPRNAKNIQKRSQSPKFFCKESKKSATTYEIDSKSLKKFSSDRFKDRQSRSASPKFFCEETEKSATTYAIDSKNRSSTPDIAKKPRATLNLEKTVSQSIINELDNQAIKKSISKDTVDRKLPSKAETVIKTSSLNNLKNSMENLQDSKPILSKSLNVFERLSKPRISNCEATNSSSKMTITKPKASKNKAVKKRKENLKIPSLKYSDRTKSIVDSKSSEFSQRTFRKSSASPQSCISDSERSASVLIVRPETILKPRNESPSLDKKRGKEIIKKGERTDEEVKEEPTEMSKRYIRDSVSRFFSEQYEKTLGDARNKVQSTGIGKKVDSSRGSFPLSLRDIETPTVSKFDQTRKAVDERCNFSRGSSPVSEKMANSREKIPEFLLHESGMPTGTVQTRKEISETSSNGRSSLKSPKQRIVHESSTKLSKIERPDLPRRSSKTPDRENKKILNRRGSGHTLRSTKLIRDALKRQNDENRSDYSLTKRGMELRSPFTISKDVTGISEELKGRSKRDESIEASRKIVEASKTLGNQESSPKSSISMVVDKEIEEITVGDRYAEREHLRTYLRSNKDEISIDEQKSYEDRLSTYSVRKPIKKRGSLLESNVFQPSKRDQDNTETLVGSKRVSSSLSSIKDQKSVHQTLKKMKCETDGKRIPKPRKGTPIPGQMNLDKTTFSKIKKSVNDKNCLSIDQKTINKLTSNALNRKIENKVSRSRTQTSNSLPRREKMVLTQTATNESKKRKSSSPEISSQGDTLRSMTLVRRIMKEKPEEKGKACIGITRNEQIKTLRDKKSSSLTKASENEIQMVSEKKNFERRDSVESALRRFDSIGGDSIRSILEQSNESISERKHTESYKPKTSDDSTIISLKHLDPSKINPKSLVDKSFTRRTTTSPIDMASSCKKEPIKRREIRGQIKSLKARNSIEFPRFSAKATSPTCKRKLFSDGDSGEENRSESSTRTVGRVSRSSEIGTSDSSETVSARFEFTFGDKISSADTMDKGETYRERSTGVGGSVKHLRSIEDIRKSIEGESWDRKMKETSKRSSIGYKGRQTRRINVDDGVAGNRKEISLPRRSGNFARGNDAFGDDTDRSSVKCTMRFFRVANSPSPETNKTETGNRARRNVPASPSKSPDMVARRPSNELKGHETKSTKRPTPVKGSEPIGNRKTTTSTTTTRKSTDVVDGGGVLENGLRSRDQTVETKHDNDSSATRKSDVFVVDFDEQQTKENDSPVPRKSMLRRQSTDKQTSSTQNTRPPSSISSISSGHSMQGQTSGSRSKMASKVKPSGSNKTSSNKSGAIVCSTDLLVPCKICNRRFAQDRVALHEQICLKTVQKKRKQFDTTMYRVRGTDLEPFVKKALACKKQPERSKKPEIKTNWRRKHEDFINAIRSAKQVQAHLAAGGKLSDLPPPPVSDTSDYIQCPHCGRKFNKPAADRHIPKCEHMLHNKPAHMRVPKPKR